jgi:hypothetical protein
MAEKEWQAKYGKTDDAWEQVKRRELEQRLEEVAVTLEAASFTVRSTPDFWNTN